MPNPTSSTAGALSAADLASFGGDQSALNMYDMNPSDFDKYNKAIADSSQALKDRYENPNWFNVAAGFAKPQLGGFTASLGSAAQALGDWQEQKRNNVLQSSQLDIRNAQNALTMGQNKAAADKLKGLVSGQTPINPVTVADTVATAPGAATAETAKNMLPSISTATANTVAAQNVLPVNGVAPDLTGASTVPQPVQDAINRNKNADATGRKHNMQDDAIVSIGGTQTDTSNAANPASDNTAELHRVDEDLKAAKLERSKSTNMMQRASLDAAIDDLQNHRAKLTGSTQAPQQISPPVNQPAAQPVQQNSTLSPAQQAGLTQTAAVTREAGYSDLHKQNALPFTDDKMQLIGNAITPLAKILKLPETAQSLGVLNGMSPGVKAAAAITANGGAKASLQTPFGGLGGALTVPVVDIMNATNLTPEQRTNLLTIRNGIAQVKSLMGNSDASAGLMRDVSEANSVDDVRRVLANAYATASQGNLVQKAKQKYDSHTNGLYTGFQDSQERQDALEKAKDNFLRAAKIGMPK